MSQREHGGNIDHAAINFGHESDDMLDLSTGISPVAYPCGDISAMSWQRLPTQSEMDQCLAAARRAYDVPPELAIMAGSGTQSLLQAIPHLVTADGPVWIAGPTYNEHAPAWQVAGHDVTDTQTLPAAASSAVIVAPNNPTGDFAGDSIISTAKALADRRGILLIDGAFTTPSAANISANDDTSLMRQLANQSNIIHLRSFGKFFGMAGLRLGFAIGPSDIIGALIKWAGPWAVNSAALSIGTIALDDTLWQQRHGRFMQQQAGRLLVMMESHGFKIRGGTCLFLTIENAAADDFHQHLACAGIWVRKYANWPNLLRFGVPATDAEFARLEETIKDWRSKVKQ